MKQHWLRLLCAGLIVAAQAAVAPAAEQHLEFLNGLRERGYYDYAQLYLNQLDARDDLPADVKAAIPYERAVTLLAESRTVRNPDDRRAMLEQAQGLFEKFASASPDDPRAADANHERATIFLERAKVAIHEASLPQTDKRKQQDLRDQARQAVGQARKVFDAALQQYETVWKAFPAYVDKDKEREKHDARERAEQHYLQAKLDVALCTYWEAQTYKSEEPQFNKLLGDASAQFEAIHTAHRTQVVGLYGRTYQGRCFELMGDYGKALGIYNELLGHPSDDPVMLPLKDQVLQFKLSVLNRKGDHQLAVAAATEWLEKKENRGRSRTSVGVGILFERAAAREKLAATLDDLDPEYKKQLGMALADAREIRNFPYAEHRDPAVFMEQRIKVALGDEGEDPKNFNDAVALAQTLQEDAENLESDLTAAKEPEARQRIKEERDFKLAEGARILRLGLGLAGPDVDSESLDRVRLTLCYFYLQADRNYEAAVLGEFLGRRLRVENPEAAQTATFLALAAYQQEYSVQVKDRPARDPSRPQDEEKGEFEIARMVELAKYLTETWPDSERATQARTLLGQIHELRDQPLEAAAFFAAVPATAPGYADSQIRAGQGYWNAYLKAAALPDDDKPTQEQLDQWTELALKHIQTGLDKKAIPSDSPAPDEFIAAKLTLAQIRSSQKQYDETLKILTQDPHAVMKAVAVKEGEARPQTGVKRVAFAMLAHRVLLFAQVGKEQTDDALKTLDDLENLVPENDRDTLNQIYVSLGQGLREEMEIALENNRERFDQLLAAFDKFLGALLERKDNLSFGQLRWVAATFDSLGETLEKAMNPAAFAYYKNAATTYETIIRRIQAEQDFAPGVPLSGFRLLLAGSLARQQDFETAMATIEEVLKEKPAALDAQFKAADILQAWGESGQTGAEDHFADAVLGRKIEGSKEGIWGYNRIADKMRVQLKNRQEQYRPQYYEAIHKRALARRGAAAALSGEDRTKALSVAKAELEGFVAVNDPKKIGEEWWSKFDAAYRDIQRDMGAETPVALKRPESLQEVAAIDPDVGVPPTPDTGDPTGGPEPPKPPDKKPTPKAESGGGMLGFLIMGGILLAGAGGIGWMVMNSKKTPKKRVAFGTGGAASDNLFDVAPGTGGASTTPQPVRQRSAAATRPAAKAPTAPVKPDGVPAAATAKPAARPKAAGPSAPAPTRPAKPKPKPTE